MHSKLGGGHRKNEPASARVNRRQAEHVPEERTDLLSLGREHYRMQASDHVVILAAAWPGVERVWPRTRERKPSGPADPARRRAGDRARTAEVVDHPATLLAGTYC